tara:strand:- start:1400 stop:2029 length:630 start_codon:yes stop_codon:yes gene_type:complete
MANNFLHVGCGRLTKEHSTPEFMKDKWTETRLDIDESVNPDIVASLTDMSVVDSNSFDSIYSSHNIEHLFAHEVPIALKEMHRILNSTGYLIITCPDLQSVCEHIAEGRLTDKLYDSGMGPISPIDILYGHRASIQNGNHYMAHKVGFTASVLNSTLLGVGFKSAAVVQHKRSYNLWGIGYKELDSDKETLAKELNKHVNFTLLADSNK